MARVQLIGCIAVRQTPVSHRHQDLRSGRKKLRRKGNDGHCVYSFNVCLLPTLAGETAWYIILRTHTSWYSYSYIVRLLRSSYLSKAWHEHEYEYEYEYKYEYQYLHSNLKLLSRVIVFAVKRATSVAWKHGWTVSSVPPGIWIDLVEWSRLSTRSVEPR
eukprot:scaffold45002_cov19-Prasinocladus_malaysianus.AAC.1